MKIDTCSITIFKQRNPSKSRKVVSVIKQELNSTSKKQAGPVSNALFYTKESEPAVLGKLIETVLEKKEITDTDESLIKKTINCTLTAIKHPKNILGRGFHEDVYRINDKYAVKIPDENYLRINDPDTHLKIPDNEFKDLEVYKGGILLQVGDFKILENLGKHLEAGIPIEFKGKNEIEYYRSVYLPTFSKVSQESFDKIASDCVKLNNKHNDGGSFYYYAFDLINPNNIVLKDNKLYWVDKIRTGIKEECTTTKLLNMLLNKYGISTSDWIYDGFDDKTKYARIIFKKIVLAGMRTGLPFGENSYINNKILENILNNLNINNRNSVISELRKIDSIQDIDLKLSKTQKLLNNCID